MPNQKGFAPILILLAALGIILFLLISSSASFKDRLFSLLYPKPSSHAQQTAESVSDEILLKFKDEVDDKGKDNIRQAYGLEKLDEISKIGVERSKVPEKAKDKIIEALSHNPRVKYVEQNILANPLVTPNDPYFLTTTSGWNLNKIGASAAWDISKGSSSVIVGVIDTGAYAEHEDLAGKVVAGYNFVDNSTDTLDTHGHGTGVSGVVGAVTNNGKGIASLGSEVSIMPLKVVAPNGSISTYNIANAITYGADHGAKVINISLGSPSASSTLQEAINYAWGKNLILVAAAGNDGTSGIYYPAASDNVIAVGATDSTDVRWAGSNYGPQLDVMAPGVGIYSPNLTVTGYSNYGGTSYASPHVAALAALIISVNSALTNQQAVDIITNTALDLGDSGLDQYYGNGRIQADKALQKATVTTPAPTPSPTPSPTPIPTPSDIISPTVSINSPSNGITVSGTTTISGQASDNVSIAAVNLLVEGGFYSQLTSSPYNFSLDTTTLTNGSHTMQITALDPSSNLGVSSIITVSVNNAVSTPSPTATPSPIVADITPPSVSLSNPINGSIVKANSTVNITVSASDNIKVSKVEFYVGGSLKCTSAVSPYTCSWKVPGKKNTSYTIKVVVYDTANNSTPALISVKAQ